MTRDTLQNILHAAGNLQEKANSFKATAEQRLTFYIGNDGRGLAVSQVEEARLEDAYVLLKTKEAASVFADYAAIFAVSVQPPKENAPKKAGFA